MNLPKPSSRRVSIQLPHPYKVFVRAVGSLSQRRRGLISIIAGTGGGQIAILASAPIVSRLYEPSAVGHFGVVAAIALALGAVAALRFDAAIPLPTAPRDAYSLLYLGVISAVGVGACTELAVYMFNGPMGALLDFPQGSYLLYSTPILVVLIGIFSVLNQLAIRQRHFNVVARRNLFNGVAMAGSQVLGGFLGLGTGGMVLGFGVGQAAGLAGMMKELRIGSEEALAGRTLKRFRVVGGRYRRFPLVLAPSALLNVSGLQIPIVLMAWMFGGEVAGWFGMTQRILAMPMSLIGLAIAQVFLAELSNSAREDGGLARSLFLSASKRLLWVSLAFSSTLMIAGPPLFSCFLGAQWATSGVYARALSISLALQLLASPVSQTLTVYERQFVQLAWDLGRIVVVVGAIVITATIWHSAIITVWTYGCVSATTYGASWWLSYRTVCSVALEVREPGAAV